MARLVDPEAAAALRSSPAALAAVRSIGERFASQWRTKREDEMSNLHEAVKQAIIMLYPQLALFAGSTASAVLSVAYPQGARAAMSYIKAKPGVLVDALESDDPDATWAFAKMCALAAASLPGSKCSAPLHAAGIVFYVPRRTFRFLEKQAEEGRVPKCSVALFLTRYASLLATGGDVNAAAMLPSRKPADWAFDVVTILDQAP